jgi:hypothetical protein
MITLTALVALLGLGWGALQLWKRAMGAARKLAETEAAMPVPTKS